MTTSKARFALLTLLISSFTFMFCSSGGYQNWYAEEGQEEEDLLGGLFSEDDYSADQAEQPVTSGRWDSWYNEDQSAREPSQDPFEAPESTKQAPPVQPRTPDIVASSKYSPEFKVTVVREEKLAQSNKIRLLLQSNVRIPELEESNWKVLKKAQMTQIDGDAVLASLNSSETDENGLIRAVISPTNPNEYFGFVPLEQAGLNAAGFAAPYDALSLHAVTFNFTAPTNQSFKYQYSFQTYNIKSVVSAFAEYMITPHVKKVRINILDSETHYPVSDAVVTITGSPPSPMKILSPYIAKTELLVHAVKTAPDYVLSEVKQKTGTNGLLLSFYYPFTYKINIVHANYFYVTQDIAIDDKTETLDFYLSRRPENVRIIEQDGDAVVVEPQQ